MEALREELLSEGACASLGQAVAKRSAGDGGTGVLIVWEVLRVWQAVVCDFGKSLSSARLQVACTSSVLTDNRVVTELLGHRCRPVSAVAWQILHEMVDTQVDEGFLVRLQQAAMRDGAVLRHLHAALFHADTAQQSLSRKMCAVWMEGNEHAQSLMVRCLPIGMSSLVPSCHVLSGQSQNAGRPAEASILANRNGNLHGAAEADTKAGDLSMPDAKGRGLEKTLQASPVLAASLTAASAQDHAPASAAGGSAKAAGGGVGGGGGGVAGGTGCNSQAEQVDRNRERTTWEEFLGVLMQDRSTMSQRWNARTRLELRTCLELEMSRLNEARENLTHEHELGADSPEPRDFAWNHEEFAVEYASLEKELCVGGVFLQHALDLLGEQPLLCICELDQSKTLNCAIDRLHLCHNPCDP